MRSQRAGRYSSRRSATVVQCKIEAVALPNRVVPEGILFALIVSAATDTWSPKR